MSALTSPAPGRLWAWVPALILVALLGTQLVVLANVLQDPGFATESDYYQKGVDWDARQERRRQSSALGWKSELSLGASATPGQALVQARLTDALGRPLHGAQLRALAFHNARASRTFEVRFEEVAPGSYRAELGSARAGLWELRVSAQRGADLYEQVFRLELQADGRAR